MNLNSKSIFLAEISSTLAHPFICFYLFACHSFVIEFDWIASYKCTSDISLYKQNYKFDMFIAKISSTSFCIIIKSDSMFAD